MRSVRLGPSLGVFFLLLGSYAYFWHSRDWNISSRLMLTYALVDRGQVSINGLEDHTRDRARIGDRFYSDKQPGYSLLAVPPYLVCRLFGLPPHPLERKGEGFAYWSSDYWITLGTSGVFTALCGSILTIMAGWLGCGPRRSVLIGLAYGLATPAYVYATLAYGHQATSCLLLLSFGAIERSRTSRVPWRLTFLAGACAAGASVVELQVAPVSALLGLYVVGLVLTKKSPGIALFSFILGAVGPSTVLLVYNTIAFGSPLDMGYFHEDLAQFRDVHSAKNPLGLRGIDGSRVIDLLARPHRGLIVYAPVLLLAIPGFLVLVGRGRWAVAIVSLSACLVVFLVNLSYPEWTGGMSTGPRLLLPLVPFAMLLVAASLAGVVEAGSSWNSNRIRILTMVAIVLTFVGAVEMLMFQGVGGRIPPAPQNLGVSTPFDEPWRKIVWPLWKGDPIPPWKQKIRFEPTIVSTGWPQFVSSVPAPWTWLQFLPLVGFQITSTSLLLWWIRARSDPTSRNR